MKINNLSGKAVITSGNMTGSDMSISNEKGGAIAAFYLRDAIYSDKEMAVVREYSTNGLDEHYKLNIDTPVELRLRPDAEGTYQFSVRDYGNGLNDNDIRTIFGGLFESTKTESNDLMGGFGIGSKSGHAYTDMFTVISYHDGYKSTYVCPLETDPEVSVPRGKIYDLAVEDTTETGLEVIVPVPSKDRYSFESKIEKFVENCRSTAPIVAYIHQGTEITTIKPKEEYTETEGIFSFSSSSSDDDYRRSYSSYNNDKIRMGDVCYPLPSDISFNNKCLTKHVILDVPVGSIKPALSRESLEHTESSKALLKKALLSLDALYEKAKDSISLTFDNICEDTTYTEGLFSWKISDMGYPKVSVVKEEDEPDNKYLVWIPNNRARTDWIVKLRSWVIDASDNNSYYLYVDDNPPKSEDKNKFKELDDTLNVVSVKTIKAKIAPKSAGESSDVEYVVYKSGVKYKLNLDSFIAQFEENTNSKDEKLDIDNIPKLDDIHSINELQLYCVDNSTKASRYDYTTRWLVGSSKFHKQLVDKGLYDYNSAEVSKRRSEIRKFENEILDKLSEINTFKKGFSLYSTTGIVNNALKGADDRNKPNKLDRVFKRSVQAKKTIEKISKEKSPRGEILRTIKDRYYYGDRISRSTFRAILKMVK